MLKRYKLKYKAKISENITSNFNKTYIFYNLCYNRFKKVIQDQTTISAYIDKYEKRTGKYSEQINSYIKGGKVWFNVKGR